MAKLTALSVLFYGLALGFAEEYYEHRNHEPIYYSDHGYDSYLSDGSSDGSWGGGGRLQQSKCEDIPANMSLCKNIGYTKMRFPNLLGHDTMTEMLQQARPWVPLLGIGCHENTKLFLCSLFSPVCVDRPIYPCRTFCEAVKAGCESRMLTYGYPWPEMLRCDKFPLDNDLCLGPQTANAEADDSVCDACDHPDTFEAFVDSFCTSDFALRVRVDEQIVSGDDLKLTVKSKKKKYKSERLSKRELRNLLLYVKDGATCDCPQLTSAGSKDRLIVMGGKKDGRAVVTNIFKYDRQSKELKRAIKAIQKPNFCKKGLWAITAGDEAVKEDNAKKQGRKNDKKGRKERGSERKEGERKERQNKRHRDGPKERSKDRRRNRGDRN